MGTEDISSSQAIRVFLMVDAPVSISEVPGGCPTAGDAMCMKNDNIPIELGRLMTEALEGSTTFALSSSVRPGNYWVVLAGTLGSLGSPEAEMEYEDNMALLPVSINGAAFDCNNESGE